MFQKSLDFFLAHFVEYPLDVQQIWIKSKINFFLTSLSKAVSSSNQNTLVKLYESMLML